MQSISQARSWTRAHRSRVGCACAAALALLVLLPSVALADVSAVEGQSFSGDVAAIGGCGLASATIDWGDQTPSSPGAADGNSVQGTHTYAEEGTYAGSVSYACTQFGGVQMATFTATVQDAPLAGVGRDVSGAAGQPLSGVVAHVADGNPSASAADLSGQIAWGDGSTSAGMLTAAAGGGFEVSATHTYQAAGSYPISTTVTDTGGSTTGASSTAQISAGPPPPPPPPPPPILGPPTARFTYSPANPCRDDAISFDASASGSGSPITQYRWTFANVTTGAFSGRRSTVQTAVTTAPTLTRAFGAYSEFSEGLDPAYADFGPYGPIVYMFRLLRPPITVSLSVLDSTGRTASITRAVTFVNPSETIDYDEQSVINGSYLWTASSNVPLCQKRTDTAADFAAAVIRQVVSLSGTSVLVQVGCSNPLLNCVGVVDLRSSLLRRREHRSAARRQRSDPGLLGRNAFVIPAGQMVKLVVKLNARGRALAHAHKLRTVILQLDSFRAKGKIVTTTRTVRVRTRRPR
ncbi:MAG: hypothetical protein ACR2NR_06585 [Solirubrobacteraceae bacterium]